jgi:hypothetical protein
MGGRGWRTLTGFAALLLTLALLSPLLPSTAEPAAAAPTRVPPTTLVRRAVVAVFRPSTGAWLLRGLPDATFGRRGDQPVPADYNGDGRTDLAVWRPTTGTWLLRGLPDITFGRRGDQPVPADYNGDGRTDLAVWRPTTGTWLLRGLPDAALGRRGDRPVPADDDGNSTTDLAVWRPATGTWLRRGRPDVTWGRRGDLPVRVSTPSTPTAPFHAVVTSAPSARMRASWRAGCPVPIRDLRLLTVTHVGFDRLVHRGELVVHRAQAARLATVFHRLYDARFPIRRMRLVDEYGADDDRSMSDDNTSAFSCRAVTGRPGVWSQHSYGWAVDVNPFENPYVSGGTVLPREAKRYADRSRRDRGMIHAGDATVRAFAAIGWRWGGSWRSPKDYQHFSVTGR